MLPLRAMASNCVPLLSISPPVPAALPEGPAFRDKTSIHIRYIPSKSDKSVLQSILQSIQIPSHLKNIYPPNPTFAHTQIQSCILVTIEWTEKLAIRCDLT